VKYSRFIIKELHYERLILFSASFLMLKVFLYLIAMPFAATNVYSVSHVCDSSSAF